MVQILVIDDEEPIRKLLARIIELEGYKVSTASCCNGYFCQQRRGLLARGNLKTD